MNSQLSLTDIESPVDAKTRWQRDAELWLLVWLTEHRTLFCEDIQAPLADAVGPPRDKAWLGPVIRRLATAGVIRKHGYRQGTNGSPKDVWASLRFRR